jgi:tripartite-type tricarboxylate transporter receptor subunit TctC
MANAKWNILIALGGLILGAVDAGKANAQSAETAFYRGKTVTIYSGLSAGGAYTAYARLLERNLGRHIPGSPAMVVKMMEGASGRTLANWLYNVAARDGSIFGIFHESLGIEPIIDPQGLRYQDGRKFTWLGSLAKQTFVCFTWAATGLATVDDLRSREGDRGQCGFIGIGIRLSADHECAARHQAAGNPRLRRQ